MRKFIGFVIILIGAGFLLQQAGVGWADELLAAWWPFVIIGVGLMSWASNRRMWFGPLLITLVGLVLLFDQLNLMDESAWNYFWPVIIILVGARFLMGRRWEKTGFEKGDANAHVMFSGIDRKVSGPFTVGDASAWFGGVKLDMREAQFADQAELSVFAAFGGIDLWVPKHVRVNTKVLPLFGGSDDKTTPNADAKAILTVRGTAMFGGVSIKNGP